MIIFLGCKMMNFSRWRCENRYAVFWSTIVCHVCNAARQQSESIFWQESILRWNVLQQCLDFTATMRYELNIFWPNEKWSYVPRFIFTLELQRIINKIEQSHLRKTGLHHDNYGTLIFFKMCADKTMLCFKRDKLPIHSLNSCEIRLELEPN